MSDFSILAAVIFGGIGFSAFIYGKKQSKLKPMLIGAALSVYPYFITEPLTVFIIGIALTVSLFIFRD